MLTTEENAYVVGISSLVKDADEEIVSLGRLVMKKGGVQNWKEEDVSTVARRVDRVRSLAAEAEGFARQPRLSLAKTDFDMGMHCLVQAAEALHEAVRDSDDKAATRGRLYMEAAKSSMARADAQVGELV